MHTRIAHLAARFLIVAVALIAGFKTSQAASYSFTVTAITNGICDSDGGFLAFSEQHQFASAASVRVGIGGPYAETQIYTWNFPAGSGSQGHLLGWTTEPGFSFSPQRTSYTVNIQLETYIRLPATAGGGLMGVGSAEIYVICTRANPGSQDGVFSAYFYNY